MNHREIRLQNVVDAQRARQWLMVIAMGLFSVAGCGGGAAGSANDTPDTSPPSESAYWLAALTEHQGKVSVVAWDPASSSQTLRSFPASSNQMLRAPARTYDPAQRTRTEVGQAMSFFLQDGHLMKVDLRGGQPHDAVQVSDVADACSLQEVHPLDAQASLSWVLATRKDTAGNCSRTALMRSDMSASTPAKPLPAIRLLGTLADDKGAVSALLMASPANSGSGEWLQAFDRDLNSLGSVGTDDGASGQSTALLAFEPTEAGLAYVAVGGEVRQLRWSGTQVTLVSGSMHHLMAQPATWLQPGAVALPHDSGQLYLVDGSQVLNLQDGQSILLGSVDAGETIDRLMASSAHLVLHSDVDYLFHYVKSLPKAGGAAITLASGAMTQNVSLLGVTADWVLLTQSNESGSSFRRVSPTGSQTDTLAGTPAGTIWAATNGLGSAPTLQSVLLCMSSGQANENCSASELMQIDVATWNTLSLGSTGFQSAQISFTGFAGLSGAFAAANGDWSEVDALVATPGQASSLARVTHNLP
jgi:hypothetical protein